MWAGADEGDGFRDFGRDPRYTRAFGHAEPVRVVLTETEEGPFWGWLRDRDDERGFPSMIYRREALFRVCFPNRVEDEKGGRVVRLSVALLAAEQDR